MGRKSLPYKSLAAVLVVCFIANNLRNLFFAPSDDNIEVISVFEFDSPTSPSLDDFPKVPLKKDQDATKEELQPTPLGTHRYGDDGLLVVNPDGPHPIFELIQRAEEAWAGKHDRASKTLGEAIAEYKRRYNRPPPIHFDKWYVFTVKIKVERFDK
jgi:hypothetical protein